MSESGKREMVERFKINDWEIAASVVKALRADGYEINIAPGFKLAGVCGEPEPSGRIITVYGKRERERNDGNDRVRCVQKENIF